MMRETDFIKNFEKELMVHREESGYINPLEIFESYYFNSRCKDYREEALKRCVSERTNFSATENNKSNLMGNYIKVVCPECLKEMTYISNSRYECDCGNIIELYAEEIIFSFSKTPFKNIYMKKVEDNFEKDKCIHIFGKNKKDDEDFVLIAIVSGRYNKRINMPILSVDYKIGKGKTDIEVQALINLAKKELKDSFS